MATRVAVLSSSALCVASLILLGLGCTSSNSDRTSGSPSRSPEPNQFTSPIVIHAEVGDTLKLHATLFDPAVTASSDVVWSFEGRAKAGVYLSRVLHLPGQKEITMRVDENTFRIRLLVGGSMEQIAGADPSGGSFYSVIKRGPRVYFIPLLRPAVADKINTRKKILEDLDQSESGFPAYLNEVAGVYGCSLLRQPFLYSPIVKEGLYLWSAGDLYYMGNPPPIASSAIDIKQAILERESSFDDTSPTIAAYQGIEELLGNIDVSQPVATGAIWPVDPGLVDIDNFGKWFGSNVVPLTESTTRLFAGWGISDMPRAGSLGEGRVNAGVMVSYDCRDFQLSTRMFSSDLGFSRHVAMRSGVDGEDPRADGIWSENAGSSEGIPRVSRQEMAMDGSNTSIDVPLSWSEEDAKQAAGKAWSLRQEADAHAAEADELDELSRIQARHISQVSEHAKNKMDKTSPEGTFKMGLEWDQDRRRSTTDEKRRKATAAREKAEQIELDLAVFRAKKKAEKTEKTEKDSEPPSSEGKAPGSASPGSTSAEPESTGAGGLVSTPLPGDEECDAKCRADAQKNLEKMGLARSIASRVSLWTSSRILTDPDSDFQVYGATVAPELTNKFETLILPPSPDTDWTRSVRLEELTLVLTGGQPLFLFQRKQPPMDEVPESIVGGVRLQRPGGNELGSLIAIGDCIGKGGRLSTTFTVNGTIEKVNSVHIPHKTIKSFTVRTERDRVTFAFTKTTDWRNEAGGGSTARAFDKNDNIKAKVVVVGSEYVALEVTKLSEHD